MLPLIMGSLPEPNNIGGVVIFVSRLLSASKYLNACDYVFYSTRNRNVLHLIPIINRASFVHFNGSNPIAMLIVAAICFLLRKKLILSIHAEVGISNRILNLLERWAIKLAHKPVVGQGSISKAHKFNSNSLVISSFIIPEITMDPIVDNALILGENKKIFCTNANDFVFQNSGEEVYGISYLVDYFSSKDDSILIVADTSGKYTVNFKDQQPPNVLFINQDINFSYLLSKSDCFIRYTSTDGDSLSVMESIFLGTPVIATDCISRHESCLLCEFGNLQSLDFAIERFKVGDFQLLQVESAEKHYDALYEEVLSDK